MSELHNRWRIISIYLFISGVVLTVWWPISHWFFSDIYHQLLGFQPGTYPENMVRMIGTNGILVVLLLFITATNPRKYRNNIMVMIVFGLAIAATNLYLIWHGNWPVQEWANIIIALGFSLGLFFLYPWKEAEGGLR